MQDTFIAVSKGIRRLNDPAAFPRWIYQILHRRGVDYIRSKGRFRQSQQTINSIDREAFDEDKMTSKIDIQKALNNLTDDSYRLVHLHYLHGFNMKEIARITGIPEGTVKSRLHAARKHLKRLLGDT